MPACQQESTSKSSGPRFSRQMRHTGWEFPLPLPVRCPLVVLKSRPKMPCVALGAVSTAGAAADVISALEERDVIWGGTVATVASEAAEPPLLPAQAGLSVLLSSEEVGVQSMLATQNSSHPHMQGRHSEMTMRSQHSTVAMNWNDHQNRQLVPTIYSSSLGLTLPGSQYPPNLEGKLRPSKDHR